MTELEKLDQAMKAVFKLPKPDAHSIKDRKRSKKELERKWRMVIRGGKAQFEEVPE